MKAGPEYHPDDQLLMDAAVGALCPLSHLLVQTHCALCPACQASLLDYEAIGNAVISDNGRCNAPLAENETSNSTHAGTIDDPVLAFTPPALRGMVIDALAIRDWHILMPGLASLDLDGVNRGDRKEVAIVRFGPGVSGPWHTHDGAEAKVVLSGMLMDHRGTYHKGDMVISGPDLAHCPTAGEDEACYCFMISDAPAILIEPPDTIDESRTGTAG